jgi:hypothetical protein
MADWHKLFLIFLPLILLGAACLGYVRRGQR